MESQQYRTEKISLRTVAGFSGMAAIVASLIVYSQVSDEMSRQLCGVIALLAGVITMRVLMSNPTKTNKTHENH
jgi:hypothetical protein